MRKKLRINIPDIEIFKKKLIWWANRYPVFLWLDSNNYYQNNHSKYNYNTFNTIVAVGTVKEFHVSSDSFNRLKNFADESKDWLFGHFNYDLKNEVENLSSGNIDYIKFPDMYFFVPEYIFIINDPDVEILIHKNNFGINKRDEIIDQINDIELINHTNVNSISPEPRVPKDEYIQTINKLLKHIQYGDIYELNYCNEFYSNDVIINPIETYLKLKSISPTPFSGFYKLYDKFLISVSPERFIKKIKNKIISQPIKGTSQRGINQTEDNFYAGFLKSSLKEKAENTMIVDLVRNDLSKHAIKGSVNVEELCGVYSFSHVHQMISTISATINGNSHPVDIIKDAFPMGSMTGAPKIKAMQLIEDYERTKRGLYSGSIGYFTPELDFDFNVIIRSIIYNMTNQYLNYMVGSAITAKSIPENEYYECLLKAKAMQECLSVK